MSSFKKKGGVWLCVPVTSVFRGRQRQRVLGACGPAVLNKWWAVPGSQGDSVSKNSKEISREKHAALTFGHHMNVNGLLHQHVCVRTPSYWVLYFPWVNCKACQLHLSKVFLRILNMSFHYIIANFFLAAWGNILTMKILLEGWDCSSWWCARWACVRSHVQSSVLVGKKRKSNLWNVYS